MSRQKTALLTSGIGLSAYAAVGGMMGQLDQISSVLITISGIISSVAAILRCQSEGPKLDSGVEA